MYMYVDMFSLFDGLDANTCFFRKENKHLFYQEMEEIWYTSPSPSIYIVSCVCVCARACVCDSLITLHSYQLDHRYEQPVWTSQHEMAASHWPVCRQTDPWTAPASGPARPESPGSHDHDTSASPSYGSAITGTFLSHHPWLQQTPCNAPPRTERTEISAMYTWPTTPTNYHVTPPKSAR